MPGISAWHNELTSTWWSWAATEDNVGRAPAFLRPLVRGEVTRVEASQQEIDEAMAWASSIEGWEPVPDGSKPLKLYDRNSHE
jgi:hypothetical protein